MDQLPIHPSCDLMIIVVVGHDGIAHIIKRRGHFMAIMRVCQGQGMPNFVMIVRYSYVPCDQSFLRIIAGLNQVSPPAA